MDTVVKAVAPFHSVAVRVELSKKEREERGRRGSDSGAYRWGLGQCCKLLSKVTIGCLESCFRSR